MRLSINKIRFRNFISFGSKWQELELQPVVNIILGRNGSGKSSLLETIPFALFGKTHNEVKKEELINWKNRKQTEVELYFSKGDNEYQVLRAIKPDKFEIYMNGNLIPQPSHVKYYQSTLEDIIGTNFQTFMSLIHSNINSRKSSPILAMNKPDKRKLMEKIFGLSTYSDLNEICNKKLASLETKIRESELNISHNIKSLSEAEERIKNIEKKLLIMRSSQTELNDTREKLSELNDSFDNKRFEKVCEEVEIITKHLDYSNYLNNKITTSKKIFKSKFKDISKRMELLPEIEITENAESLKKKHGEISIETKNLNVLIKETTHKHIEAESIFKIERERLKLLLNNKECPTCKQKVTDDLVGDIKNTVSSTLTSIDIFKETLMEYNKSLSDNEKVMDDLGKKISEIEEAEKNNLKRKVLKSDERRYKNTLKKLVLIGQKIELSMESNIKSIENIKTERDELNTIMNSITFMERDVKSLEDKVTLEDNTRKEFGAILTTDKKKSKEYTESNNTLQESIKNLNNMKDYINSIKVICKDENIKAYAISSILPFLVKRTNHYLSEIGRGFYLVLDKWLEPEIKGPGITKGSYGSLSGGESRSVDLSLQIAFLDIARIQAGVFPDILVFDELLDGSVDSESLERLTTIVAKKQEEDNSKVFIISHRNEVGEIKADNEYFMTKESGFSCLQV